MEKRLGKVFVLERFVEIVAIFRIKDILLLEFFTRNLIDDVSIG
jgi:hypothetical protein